MTFFTGAIASSPRSMDIPRPLCHKAAAVAMEMSPKCHPPVHSTATGKNASGGFAHRIAPWQGHHESGSVIFLFLAAHHVEPTLVLLHNSPGDPEPQSRPCIFLRGEKRLEDSIEQRSGDAMSCIRDSEAYLVHLRPHFDRQDAVWLHRIQGV